MTRQEYWNDATPRLQELHQQVIQQRLHTTIIDLRDLIEKAEMSGMSEHTLEDIRKHVMDAIGL